MASSQTPERFAHVANLMLRGVLESPPDQVKPARMRQALKRTLGALLRDETPTIRRFIALCPHAVRPPKRRPKRWRAIAPPVATARCAGSGAFNAA